MVSTGDTFLAKGSDLVKALKYNAKRHEEYKKSMD